MYNIANYNQVLFLTDGFILPYTYSLFWIYLNLLELIIFDDVINLSIQIPQFVSTMEDVVEQPVFNEFDFSTPRALKKSRLDYRRIVEILLERSKRDWRSPLSPARGHLPFIRDALVDSLRNPFEDLDMVIRRYRN